MPTSLSRLRCDNFSLLDFVLSRSPLGEHCHLLYGIFCYMNDRNTDKIDKMSTHPNTEMGNLYLIWTGFFLAAALD